jgi:ABC-type nitrate/sulfonate/bicarbonate transport system substrate-binding protein
LKRFGKIIGDASSYVNAHPAEAAAVYEPFAALPAATILDNGISFCATSLQPRDIQPLIDEMAKYGLIERRIDANDFILK